MNYLKSLSVATACCLAVTIVVSSCKRAQVRPTGPIVTETPERASGQSDVLGLQTEPIANVGIGIVGLGMRGYGAVERLTFVPGCHIAAICDIEQERVGQSASYLNSKGLSVNTYGGQEDSYKQLCEDPSIDLVYICTDWISHTPIALYAMEHGKHVAIEVPAATSLEECWALVDMAEKKRLHCMMLENCCYDFFELQMLSLAQAGVFGEIIHAEGAYHHDLGEFWDEYWNNWRLDFNMKHRGDLYPTHGFGPVCQALNIHRGDRMTTLTAMDTDSFNGRRFVRERTGEDADFKSGDLTMSMIRTGKGKTILIEHDVMTPRPYNRMYQLVGTKGYAAKYPVEQVLIHPKQAPEGSTDFENLNSHHTLSAGQLAALCDKYTNPLLSPEFIKKAKAVGGHGGMDFIMDYRMVYCLNNGLPLDMDVYDLAEWCCISELSAISIEHGGMPVEVPDFTRGAWDKVQGFSYAFAE